MSSASDTSTRIPAWKAVALSAVALALLTLTGISDTGSVGAYDDVGSRVRLDVADSSTSGLAAAPVETKLLAAGGDYFDYFGSAVAIDDDVVVVGAERARPGGKAYVFERLLGDWTQTRTLDPGSLTPGARFGASVDVDGDTIVVGAPSLDTGGGTGAGGAYVWVRDGGGWTHQQTIHGTDVSADDGFGSDVAVYQDALIVGAPLAYDGGIRRGTASVYSRTSGTWTLDDKFSEGADDDRFGSGVDIKGDSATGHVAIVGAPRADVAGGASGTAYVYRQIGGGWSVPVQFEGGDTGGMDHFGISVGLDAGGTTAVVGAEIHEHGGSSSWTGSAYVFALAGPSATQMAELLGFDSALADYFGSKVSINDAGDRVVIGAFGHLASSSSPLQTAGAAYVYDRFGDSWGEAAPPKLIASDRYSHDAYGWGVDVSGHDIIIGAPQWESRDPSPKGKAYVYGYPRPNLRLVKVGRPDPVAPDQELFYELSVTNESDDVWATGVTVTDELPIQLDYIEDTGDCTLSEGSGSAGEDELECALPDLAPGASYEFEIKTRVRADAAAGQPNSTIVIENTASVRSNELDDDPADNTVTERTFVEALVDLAVDKTDSSDPVPAGGFYDYTVTARNLSADSTATGVHVTDTLPSGVLYIGDTAGCALSEGTGPSGEDELDCDLPDLPPGAERSFQVGVRANLCALDEQSDLVTVVNSAEVTCTECGTGNELDAHPADNTTTEGTFVDCDFDLGIAKSDGPDPVLAGEMTTYTVSVTNFSAQATATGVKVQDVLPSGVEYIDDTGYCVLDAGAGANGEDVLDSCGMGAISPGGSESFEITVRLPADFVADTATGTRVITNTARICDYSGGPCSPFLDAAVTNNEFEEGTLVAEEADLRVIKYSKPDTSIGAGERFTYTIYVENLGPSSARNVTVRDEILSAGDFELAPGGCILDPSLDDAGCFIEVSPEGGLTLEADLREPLAPQSAEAGGRWAVQVPVIANAAQDVNNIVSVFTRTTDRDIGTVVGTPDPDLSNNVSTDFIHVFDQADLTFLPQPTPSAVVAGQELTYNLEVQNGGVATATNVRVEDFLPRGVSVVSVASLFKPPGSSVACVAGTPADASDPSSCLYSEAANGDFGWVSVVARVDPDFPIDPATGQGVLRNYGYLSSDAFDPFLPNNIYSATTTVTAEADLAVSKSARPDPVTSGQRLEYEITATNHGPSTAREVIVTDQLDPAVSPVSAVLQGAEGTCEILPVTPARVRCAIDVLQPSQIATIEILGEVDRDRAPSAVAGDLTNQAIVSSEQVGLTDPVSDNDSVTLATGVRADSLVIVEKTASDASPVAGGDLVYSVSARNTGPSTAKDVLVVDDLPGLADVLYVSDGSCTVIGAVVSCPAGDLIPGATYTVDVHVRLAADAACGRILGNYAFARWNKDGNPQTGEEGRESESARARAEVTIDCESDLRVRKYGKPDGEVRADETLRYTIVVDNLGPSWARGVSLKEILSSSGRFRVTSIESDRPMTCTTTPDGQLPIIADGQLLADCTLSGRLGILEASGEAVNPGRWIITLDLVAVEAQDINNTATVVSDAPDPDESNNQAHVAHEITAVADLSVEKRGPTTVTAGTEVEYQLTVTNRGPSTAENVLVYDRLPSGIVVTTAEVLVQGGQPPGSCTTGTPGSAVDKLVCGVSTMPPGDVRRIRIVADVDPGLPGGTVLENDAYVTSDNFDDSTANNFDYALTIAESVAALGVAKVAVPSTATAGEPLEYQITVTNGGPSDAADVVVVDDLPGYVSFVSANVTVGGGTCLGLPAGSVTCQLGTLPAGESVQISIETLVDPAFPCEGAESGLINTVTVSSPSDPDGADTQLRTPVVCGADLETIKTVEPAKQDAGRQVKYTVTVVNHGPSDAPNVEVTDTLPPEVEYELDTDACTVTGTDPQTGGQVLLCPVGSLGPGDSVSFDVWARIDPSTVAGETVVNEACAASDAPDPVEANDCATADVFVENEADLHVTKYGKPDGEVRANEVLTYTVIVDNLGPSWARGAALKDVIESSGEFELLDVTADRGMACAYLPNGGAPGAKPTLVSGRLQIDCTLADPLAVLEAIGFPNPGRWILTVTLKALEDQSVNNTADVLSEAADPDLWNNHADVRHEITSVADLRLEKTGRASAIAGRGIEWTLRVTNDGPSAAENVAVFDRLPPGIVVTSVTAADAAGTPAGSCTTGEAGNVFDRLTCGLGTMAADETRTITIRARIDPGVASGTRLENDAFVTSDTFDDDNGNNFDHTLTRVRSVAELAAAKIALPPVATAGEPLEYLIAVANGGPSDAADVVVYDELPAGVSFLGADVVVGSGACLGLPSGAVTCQLGTVAAGATTEISVRVFVDPAYDCAVDLLNTVTVTSPSDPDGATASLRTPVTCLADLEIEKSSTPVKVYAGEQKKYTVTVTNHGPSDALEVLISDILPGQTEYEINTGLCTASGNAVTCQLDVLPVGGVFSFDIYALVKPDTAPESTIENVATVSSATDDPFRTNNRARSENYVLQKADLKITKFGKPDSQVRAGEVLTYTVIVDNLGPSYAARAAVKDVLQSSGEFDLLEITSDRPMRCASTPPGAPGAVTDIVERLLVDCVLAEPLEVLEATGDPVNPGRWLLTMSVIARQTQDINNVAHVTSDAFVDPDLTNNTAYVEHAITDVADLSIEKAGPATVVAGETIEYTLTVVNHGPSDAENVVVVDRLPPGIVVTDAVAEGGDCTTGAAGDPLDKLTCGLGEMPHDTQRVVTITADVDESIAAGSILENDAFVYSDVFDDDNSNNFASSLTTVEALSELDVVKVGKPNPVTAGTQLTYRLRVDNNGPSTVRNLRLRDKLEGGAEHLTFLGYDVENGVGSCFYEDAGEPSVRCSLGDVVPGSFRTVFLRFYVAAAAPPGTLLRDTAVWLADSPISFTDGSDFDETVTVAALADLEAAKWSIPVKVFAGEQKKYTVQVTNHGPSDAVNVQLEDVLPGETVYEIDTGLCDDAGNTVTCDFGTMKPGDRVSVDIYALVRPEIPPQTVLLNTARTWSDTPDPDEGEEDPNNIAYSENLVLQKADLKVTKFGKEDGVVRAGEILTYTVIADNLGPSYADYVALKDLLGSSGEFDLVAIDSDREAVCVGLPGPKPAVIVPASTWPVTDAPPPFGVDPDTGVAGIEGRLELDCTLTSPLEVLVADGPPNSGRWILTVRVRARQQQDIDNVAVVDSEAYDPDTWNNQAYVEHEIIGVADLSATKHAAGENVVGCADDEPLIVGEVNRVTAGLELSYGIDVYNHGVADAENVVLYDRLPPGVVLTGGQIDLDRDAFLAACRTGTAGDAGDQLTCGLGTIPALGDNTVRVDFTVTVDPALAEGSILENDAYVTSDVFDDDNSNNYGSNLTTVHTAADLELEKSHDPPTVVAGELLRYTLAVTNQGPSVAREVWVYDSLPDDVTYVGGIGGDCVEDPVNDGDVTCRVGDLSPGVTTYVYLVTLVAPDVPAAILNTAVVQSGFSDDSPQPEGVLTHDPCPDDNTSFDTTPTIRRADVYGLKDALTDPIVAGTEAAYLLTFGNLGPSTATGVTVDDELPEGFAYNRCEPIDPNDEVVCSAAGGAVMLESIEKQNTVVYTRGGTLDPGVQLSFVVVADVDPGYVLDGLTDAGPGEIGEAYADASGYPFWAHNRIVVNADQDQLLPVLGASAQPDQDVSPVPAGGARPDQEPDESANNYDDEITMVIGLADLEIDKVDDLAGFLTCDPVEPGGTITYDLFVTNNGPSDSAAVHLVDWLPDDAGLVLDPEQVEVEIEGDRGVVLEKRDDGRITVLIGNDEGQSGRLNAGETVHVTIRVKVAETAECGSTVRNRAMVETRYDEAFPDGATPTKDPQPDNDATFEYTSIECASVEVNKTVSFDGQCPGSEGPVVAPTAGQPTFCLEITNTGTTWLDYITVTDTLRTRSGSMIVFTDTIRSGAAPLLPVAPGETVTRTVEGLGRFDNWDCGRVTNEVVVTAKAVNSGRTLLPCITVEPASDSTIIDVPCAGVDWRLQLPIVGGEECESWIQVQNVGDAPTKAALIAWGESGFCPPQAAGPLKVECTGLIGPGSAWSFAEAQIPAGAHSAVVYSLNALERVPDFDGNLRIFADVACDVLFAYAVGDHSRWAAFDQAYRFREEYHSPFDPSGLHQVVLDFGEHHGEPLAATVNRACPDTVDPNLTNHAAYGGISSDMEGALDPRFGGFTYYAPLIFADQAGLNTVLHIQNSGDECTSLELWFKAQDNCLRSILGDVLTLAPGETITFDPNSVVGPGWIGTAWIRGSQPLGIVVDTHGANHFTSYTGVAADVWDLDFSVGNQVNFAPLIYSEYQGWDTALQVQNLSAVNSAKVKVYFLDRGGDVITTLVDWICPRGSQTFFLPLIDAIPGNWVGSARVESQEWVTPGGPLVDPPRVATVVMLEKFGDPQRTSRREAVAYNAQSECLLYDWQIGAGRGGTQSGSAVFAVPLVAKDYRGITTELAITNLVPKPGFTDFALFIYDQNGLLDWVCEKLNEKQVEYIDLSTWGAINPRFMGSAVVSAVFWEHDVFDETGGFTRNVVGLGGVAVERIGGTLGGDDVPGDESKAFEAFPVYDHFGTAETPVCPGVPGF